MNRKLLYGLLLLFIIAIIIVIFYNFNTDKTTSKNSKLSEFNFDTKKIVIKVDKHTGDMSTYTITDQNTIDDIVNMCKSYDFPKVETKDLLDGLCEIFIIFNDNTIIGMYINEDYGNIGNKIELVGTPVWLPKGLNKYILNYLQKIS